MIQDVHAVRDRLIDRGGAVGAEARGCLSRRPPAGLVCGDARAGRDAAHLPEDDAVDDGGHAVVAGGRSGRVRAVPIRVAAGEELGRIQVLGAEPRDVEPAADAVRGVEILAGNALAVPSRDVVVVELAFAAIRVRARPIGEARMLGPHARVDVADDHVLTGAVEPAELIPQPTCSGEAEEPRRGQRVQRDADVGLHRNDPRRHGEIRRLLGGELRGETVQRVPVIVELPPATHRGKRVVVPGVEIGGIVHDGRIVRIDPLSLPGLGGAQPGDAALVHDHRIFAHAHDVAR